MYDRAYDGNIHTFEASGGLIQASLVMQDRETNSYWAIMKGEAIEGVKKGTKMVELPLGEKVKWTDWVKKHPKTLVLSVDGKEDAKQAYTSYFESENGFRNIEAKDTRLGTKDPIFAFRLDGETYAISYQSFTGGKVFDLSGKKYLFYRPQNADLFFSTIAFKSTGNGFELRNGEWVDKLSNTVLDPKKGDFGNSGKGSPEKVIGFDTFWYNWSLNNPKTILLTDGTRF